MELDLKQEVKVLKALDRIFEIQQNNPTEEEVLNRDYAVFDDANVCCITGLNDYAKKLLRRFIDKDTAREDPTLDYNREVKTGVKISAEYLEKAVKILKESGESIKVYSLDDFPIKLENEFFRIIIAPRVEN